MKKSQQYYYEDQLFQLELNLQNIRRDLVLLLEEFNHQDCVECERLKLLADLSVETSTVDSTTLSVLSSDSAYPPERDRSMDVYYNVAPPPESLPIPKWSTKIPDETETQKEQKQAIVAAWINASLPSTSQSGSAIVFPVHERVLDDINYTWPPVPSSIWSGEMSNTTEERLTNGEKEVNN